MKTRKPSERANDFSIVYAKTVSLIGRVIHEQLSHSEWIGLRDLEIFQSDEWPRLSGARQQQIIGMFHGMRESILVGMLVWCHLWAGAYRTSSELPEGAFRDINPDQSNWCWRDSRKPYY